MLPPKFRRLDLNQKLACIFTDRGELLWRSPAWTGGVRDWKREHTVLGTRWHEFVWAKDLPGVLRWFGNGREDATVFRAMLPNGGGTVRCFYHKLGWEPGVWIVVGRAVLIDTRPAAAMIVVQAAVVLTSAAEFLRELPQQ